MDLDIKTERAGAVCVVAIRGEIDLYTSASLKEHLVQLLDDGCTDIIVDLQDVGFIDSSGLGVLVGVLRRAKERDGSVRLVCTREGILKTFRITGLDKVFPTFPTVDEAKAF